MALAACALACVLTGGPVGAQSPSMFVNESEIAAVRALAEGGKEPWASTLEALLADCDGFLRARPTPVQGRFTYRPPLPRPGEPTDGNPSDEEKARRDSQIVRDLGLAYALTGKEAYAEKAVEFVSAWVASMEPVWPFDREYRAPMAVDTTLPAMFYGYDLLAGSAPRTPEFDGRMAEWAGGLVDTCKPHHTQAWVDSTAWNMTFILCGSIVSGRPENFDFVYGKTDNEDTFQSLLPALFDKDGKLAALFASDRFQGKDVYDAVRILKAFTYVAEIARHQGTDLYDWGRDGRSLRQSCAAYAPYFNGQLALPGVRSFPIGRDADACIFEIAHSQWPDREFEAVVKHLYSETLGYDVDILGPVGLTHRYRGGADQPPTVTEDKPEREPPDDRPGGAGRGRGR